jgi:ribonuclease P/MRP protein subunit POP5
MRLKLRFYICRVDLEAEGSASTGSGAGSSSSSSSSSRPVTASDLYSAIRGALLDSFGDDAVAATMKTLAVKYYSPTTRMCIVRGPFSHAKQVRAAIVAVKALKKLGRGATIRLLRVAGSLRTAIRAAARWQAELSREMGVKEDVGKLAVALGKLLGGDEGAALAIADER